MASTIVTTRAPGRRRPQQRLLRRGDGLRLTARGRIVGASSAPSCSRWSSGSATCRPATRATARRRVPKAATVVVQPGETLWQIATRVAPGTDPRTTVHRIEELNGLTTATVSAGQRLYVPARR